MNSYTQEDSISSDFTDPESCPYPESVEKRMDKNRDPRYECDMIIVLVWILVSVVAVTMIVRMWCEHLLYEIDEEKSHDKRIDRELRLFECFRKDVYDCDREHRACTECDEQIEDTLRHSFPDIEEESRSRDECEDKKWDEHG